MLTFFKRLFGKKEVTRAAPPVVARASVATPRVVNDASGQPRPQVAVAQLSLAAIITKFPDDLKRNIARVPDPSVTVALPLTTIHKQLATGSVKMSLASLYRQAPAGTFTQARVEDKRMIEIPLSEVFRHVDAQALRRRGDQRRVVVPRNAPQLFGDKQNPHLVAPSMEEEEEEMIPPPAEIPKPTLQFTPENPVSIPAAIPSVRPRAAAAAPAPAAVPAPAEPITGTLSLPISQLCGNWPEPIRSEAASLHDAQVALPAEALASGLAKGKVAFSWGQLRSWITPALDTPSEAREATELVLPLKVVAPAFLALTRPQGSRRNNLALDESIPALFAGGNPPPAVPAAPAAPAEPPPAVSQPIPAAPSLRLFNETAPAPVQEVHEAPPSPAPPEPLALAHPEPHAEAHETSAAPAKAAHTLGELFGQPEKAHWSPQEIIDRTAQLHGVAGAALALQEGLLIAAKLPEEMKGDTVAAFLPQIFARLNTYAGEMKLGQVEDVLLTTNGAHFQAYRLGELHFAVLGRPGEALPWDSLRLIVQELAAQAPK